MMLRMRIDIRAATVRCASAHGLVISISHPIGFAWEPRVVMLVWSVRRSVMSGPTALMRSYAGAGQLRAFVRASMIRNSLYLRAVICATTG